MRRIPIRIKVMAALALPLVALTLVTIVEVRDAVREEQDVSHEARLARAATGPNGLFTNLQNERNRATVDLVGQGGLVQLPVADNATARGETDRSLDEFRDVVEEQGGAAREAYAPALDRLSELEQIRQDIDANPGPFSLEANSAFSGEVFSRYTDIVGELLASSQKLSSGIENEELRRGADLSYMSSLQQDLLARLTRTLLLSIPNNGLDTNTEIQEASGLLQLANRNFENMLTVATGDYEPLAAGLVEAENERGLLERIAPTALSTGAVDAEALLASVSQSEEDQYLYDFRDGVKDLLDEKADEVDGDASQRRSLFLAFAVLVVGLAAVATWLVSRSITRPLRSLTRQADDMANRKLPEAVQDILDTPLGDDVTVSEIDPIFVQTRDEVADVSAALNTVQDSALQLAVEQAVLRRNIADSFVNLGRRNQNLLSRQLDFITELEQNETDPEVLGDLFRLDHLATRMRRNAESLLVLAGIEPPRQWAAPVRINDVVRAALGEVEGYQRVTVRAVEPVTVLGSVAADLAHIVAELVENALVFSPEDQSVEVRGRLQASDEDAYTLAIIDYGLGMSPDELDRANRRLGGAESFTVAPSKYLGHYVAGNLAARHGIVITLHNSPGNGSSQPGYTGAGITALVRLPASLLTVSTLPEAAEDEGLTDEPRELVGVGAAVAPAPAPADPGRTASGLARRTRRSAPAPQPFAPPSELIEALAQHTSLGSDPLRPLDRPEPPPQPQPWSDPQPWAPPPAESPAARHAPQPGSPESGRPQPWTAPLPGARHDPSDPRPWTTPPADSPAARHAPAEPPSWPAPATAPGSGVPQSWTAPLPESPAPGPDGDTTPSGLVRRVRGAQLPKTETVGLRRGTGEHPAVPPPPPPPEQLGSLLGDFTAGIQRGLDDARDGTDEDDDNLRN